MSVPSYTTDLATLHLSEVVTGWAEPTATGWTLGAAPAAADSENFIQGTLAVPKAFNATGVGGLLLNFGSAPTIPTDGVFMGWVFFSSPANIDTEANGGIRLIAGSALNNFKAWIGGGSDTYLYGGWINIAIDPTITADYTETGTGSNQYFGWAVKTLSNITKGTPMVTDAFRYGRAEARINGGEAGDYATFNGFAAINDANDATNGYNRWGLLQFVNGSYLWKGLMTLGYSTAVDFRDSNKTIIIDNTKKVGANFNKIEIRQATSRVDWTGISITCVAPSTTASKGSFEVIDDADVNFDNCVFTDLNTFIFKAASTILNTTFRRCGLVTQGSSVFTNCRFESSPNAVSLLSNAIENITNSTFVSDGDNHAIELTSAHAGGTYSLTGCTFTGYDSANGGTNTVIYNNSGGAVVINASGCTGTVSYKNGTGASTTVNQVTTLTLTGLVNGSDIVILNAGTTTERVNIDSNSGTTYAYGYTDSGSYIDIGVFLAGYVPFYIRNYLLATTASSLPVAQVLDRNYLP